MLHASLPKLHPKLIRNSAVTQPRLAATQPNCKTYFSTVSLLISGSELHAKMHPNSTKSSKIAPKSVRNPSKYNLGWFGGAVWSKVGPRARPGVGLPPLGRLWLRNIFEGSFSGASLIQNSIKHQCKNRCQNK